MLLMNIIIWGIVIIIVVIVGLIRAGYQLITNHTMYVLGSVAIVFIIWFVVQFNMIFAIPIYIVFNLYLGLRYIATNLFVTVDGLFYLGFDVPVIMVWVFWGLAIGAAIQGYRELKSIYGRKWIGIMVLLIPVLLLASVGVIKKVTGSPPSGSRTPTVMEQTIIGPKRELIRSTKKPLAGMEFTKSTPTGPKGHTSDEVDDSGTTNFRVELVPPPHSDFFPTKIVLIPAGNFQMGSKTGTSDQKPVHTVYVDSFYMDKYEVTYAKYKKFTDANPEWRKNRVQNIYHDGSYLKDWNGNIYPIGKDNYPVVYVSWYAAAAYAEWAGKRLPSEAEWEKAARGGLIGKKYPWGNSHDSHMANYGNHIGYTTPVGSYPENGYGLHDMTGNVHEWCFDIYDPRYYARSPRRNPRSSNGKKRVVRGGAWSTSERGMWVSRRGEADPKFTSPILGFRCVKSAIP